MTAVRCLINKIIPNLTGLMKQVDERENEFENASGFFLET